MEQWQPRNICREKPAYLKKQKMNTKIAFPGRWLGGGVQETKHSLVETKGGNLLKTVLVLPSATNHMYNFSLIGHTQHIKKNENTEETEGTDNNLHAIHTLPTTRNIVVVMIAIWQWSWPQGFAQTPNKQQSTA